MAEVGAMLDHKSGNGDVSLVAFTELVDRDGDEFPP